MTCWVWVEPQDGQLVEPVMRAHRQNGLGVQPTSNVLRHARHSKSNAWSTTTLQCSHCTSGALSGFESYGE
jgi:hypothetical protein